MNGRFKGAPPVTEAGIAATEHFQSLPPEQQERLRAVAREIQARSARPPLSRTKGAPVVVEEEEEDDEDGPEDAAVMEWLRGLAHECQYCRARCEKAGTWRRSPTCAACRRKQRARAQRERRRDKRELLKSIALLS